MEKTSRPFPLFLLLPPGLGGDKSGLIGVEGGLPLGGPGDQSASPPPLFNILLQGWSPERSSPCPKTWMETRLLFLFFLPPGRTKVEATKYKRVGTERKGRQKTRTEEPHAPRLQRRSPCPEVLVWGQKREASNARRGIRRKPINKSIKCGTRESYKGWFYPIVVILPLPGEKAGTGKNIFLTLLETNFLAKHEQLWQ